MAKILLGATVIGIRGTIAGLTFSANGTGAYVKPWSRPPRTTSVYQAIQRRNLAALSAEWRGITATQRSDWDTWAALPAQEQTDVFGDAYYLTGFLWFVKYNLWRIKVALAVRADAPTDPKPAAPAIVSVIATTTPSDRVAVTFATSTFDLDYGVVRLTRRPTSTNVTPFRNPPLWAAFLHTTDTEFTLTFLSSTVYGAVVPGTTYIVELAHQIAQGYRSAYSVGSVVAT